MAEALAAVGVVVSIVQLIDFSSKILHRLDEFRSSVGEVPKSFRHIRAELPVLQDTLRQTKEAIDAGSVEDRTKKLSCLPFKVVRIRLSSWTLSLQKPCQNQVTAGGQEAKR